ncbi:hypothetical protein [Shimia sp. R9_3]|uniref:hypothetical protein n=1 Tax=Shimia sp. R9_3 TaxID=2821113 RepID=UPI001AD9F258|nr:hypothetical protein [Shimia sp. R9_3]MBO9403411.1 hypothetical protein [Shimia sp. R9_3]
MAKAISKEHFESPKAVLTLTLDNSQPIELGAFVSAFTSLAVDYRKSLENKGIDADAEIYITEVRSGSIVADLMPVVATAFPAVVSSVEQIGQAIDFVNRWADRLNSLKQGLVPEGLTKSELKTFTDAVQAVANDPNGNQILEAATFEDGKREVKATFKFSSRDALNITKTIDAECKRLEEHSNRDHKRVLMYFTRSDIGDAPVEKRSGERAVISSITEKALPIMYASTLAEHKIKHEIREADENIFKKGFSVDVSVEYRGDRPIVYKILAVHQVLELPEED